MSQPPTAQRATWENRNFARPEGLFYLRHADALARWPILDEPWARRIEARRLGTDRPERGGRGDARAAAGRAGGAPRGSQ